MLQYSEKVNLSPIHSVASAMKTRGFSQKAGFHRFKLNISNLIQVLKSHSWIPRTQKTDNQECGAG